MREAELLVAIARTLIAHCPHRLGLSEQWTRDASASWRIVRAPCEDCRTLAEALGLALEPAQQPVSSGEETSRG